MPKARSYEEVTRLARALRSGKRTSKASAPAPVQEDPETLEERLRAAQTRAEAAEGRLARIRTLINEGMRPHAHEWWAALDKELNG